MDTQATKTSLNNPVLIAVTAVGIALSTTKTFVSRLLLDPFWEDVIVAGLLLACCGFWVQKLVSGHEPEAQQRQKQGNTAILSVVVIQIGLAIWYLLPAVAVMVHGRWRLCGTFIVPSPENACIVGYDKRGRQISDECFPLDQAGWLNREGPHWWSYPPGSFAIRRAGKVEFRFTPANADQFFDPRCPAQVQPN